MKGMQGLIVAAMLGLLGVAMNWIYLQGKTKDIVSISFLGIRSGVTIEPGQLIKDEHLEAVKIPKANSENLKEFAYLYNDRDTIVGIKATRRYQSGDLIYREHYRTPPSELKLAQGEKLIWVSVNSNSFVAELIDPGDRIEFTFPVFEKAAAPPKEEGVQAVPAARIVRTETIGPFRVASLGTRLSPSDVARGNRLASSQEQKIGIVISTRDPKELDNATRLQGKVLARDYQEIGVTLVEKVVSAR